MTKAVVIPPRMQKEGLIELAFGASLATSSVAWWWFLVWACWVAGGLIAGSLCAFSIGVLALLAIACCQASGTCSRMEEAVRGLEAQA